jgi:predicted nucleic acid-binding protein
MMLLVDSTFYIDLLRARRDPVEVLKPWLLRDEVLACGIVRCEVLRGIVSRNVHERMKALFEVLPTMQTDEATWERTAELAWNLDRRGVILPLTDLAIAASAIGAGAAVVSTDEHFRWVPELRVLSALPEP